ncbi:uncharacterized protein STEHIDRAFT_155572 [Stereum hirsutum FP-91666 SS1]|uniref:uncharacterized protein n=1 Tax=Stereum hirsutum (strain FP-91666) TaxID=721885 RepID=UPI000440FD37|nr:uncharacterized protein STEHIDRAFT_155572 [Stereum hirsutum FP-91666 SS1]EIM88218.1 hypothetical protein STEHIDRAFT_155572 [Stereum hirsutum FP-91666 SS1]
MARTPLPSFVELMQSLGLTDERRATGPFSHSRSSSLSSTTSSSSYADDELGSPRRRHNTHPAGKYLLVPSHHERIYYGKELDTEPSIQLRGKGRYSPYGVSSIPRKASMPSLDAVEAFDKPARAPSSSPLHSPLDTVFPQRSTRASRAPRSERPLRRGQKPWIDSDLPAITPISTFVRRKSPRSPSPSPTSFVFPADVHSPAAPVAIPALPTLIPHFLLASPTSTDSSSESTHLSMDIDPRSYHRTGTRISATPQDSHR